MINELITKEPGQFAVIRDLLAAQKTEIEKALPRHFSAGRMLRIALTECRKNPELLDCERNSFLGAIIQSAQLGLEPGSFLGQAYMIPFRNNKKNIREVQLLIGYQGWIDLISRGDNAPLIRAVGVYEGDEFRYEEGLTQVLIHKPGVTRDPKAKLTHCYVVGEWTDGRKQFVVMLRSEVDAIRARSKNTRQDNPWQSDFEAMAKKTVIRRFCKYIPKSVEIQRAIHLDETAERDESQKNEIFVPSETDPQSKRERVESTIDSKPVSDWEKFEK
jgi:recombination protein RecT